MPSFLHSLEYPIPVSYNPVMPTFIAYIDGQEYFSSDRPWLHPLLELDAKLEGREPGGELTTYDRVVGRASALLSARLGVRGIRTDMLSERARGVLDRYGIGVTAQSSVDRIHCATEDLLRDVWDPDEAHDLIRKRIAAARKTKEALLTVDHLEVKRGGRAVITGLSFEVLRGQTVLIRGDNGAGKTTLLRAILGLLPTTAGSIEFAGQRIGSPAWKRQRHLAAYVRQDEAVPGLPISALEVVEIGAQAAGRTRVRERAGEALTRTGAEGHANRIFGELSGGERQRVSIARALAQEPALLLLDEPTAGLDRGGRESLIEVIDGLAARQNVTVLIVSHDLTPRELPSARCLELTRGELLEDVPA